MVFLALNGWTVKTSKGGSRAPVVIGDKQRAFNGDQLEDRRVIKGRWRNETCEIDGEDATALVGLLLGRGHNFNFATDLYSGKGLSPGSTIGARRFGVDVSDASQGVVDSSGYDESKFSAYSLAIENSTTNLLTESQRRASATTGFSTVTGGSLATDTTYFLRTGESTPTSVKHTRTALNQGLKTNATSISPGTGYAASVYVYTAQASVSVDASLDDDVGAIDSTTVALTRYNWTRIELAGTSNGGSTTAEISITVSVGAAAGDIYTEAWQLEVNPAATSWADGSRATSDLEYSPSFLGDEGCTFACWVKVPTANPSALRYFVNLQESLTVNRFRLWRSSSANDLNFAVIGTNGTQNSVSYTSTPWDGDWHHIAGVVGKDKTGTGYIRLFFDGTATGTDNTIDFPDFTNAANFWLGHLDGSNTLYGLMDEVLFVPYAMSAGMVTALYNATSAVPNLPAIRATGDCIPSPLGAVVEGTVDSEAFNGVAIDGTHYNTAARVRFELVT
jgi:hypothetical protein